MDQSKPLERRLGARLDYASDFPPHLRRESDEDLSPDPHDEPTVQHSEAAARFVAYAGPYLFWAMVAALAAGIVLLR